MLNSAGRWRATFGHSSSDDSSSVKAGTSMPSAIAGVFDDDTFETDTSVGVDIFVEK
jgi:hypothetical protein